MKKNVGFIPEFDHHTATIAMYPFRTDIWRENAVHMQNYVIDLVNTISHYEPVLLVCREMDVHQLEQAVSNNTTIIPMEYDDIWARDIGPTFVRHEQKTTVVNWKFNSWGGLKEGSYFPWDKDDAFAKEMANYLGLDCEDADIVLEGGAILTDGEGTVFTTKSVILNRNRNPFKSKHYIEEKLKHYLKANQVVWLEQGLAFDETNGHIDNVMTIVRPNEVCIAWTDDKSNPNYKRVRKIESDLKRQYECVIHKIPLPTQLYMTAEESNGLTSNVDAIDRNEGDLLPASYLNYYVLNGAVLLPAFGCKEDDVVLDLLQKIYPDKKVEQIFSREPLLGGGGIHCILHEVPDLR